MIAQIASPLVEIARADDAALRDFTTKSPYTIPEPLQSIFAKGAETFRWGRAQLGERFASKETLPAMDNGQGAPDAFFGYYLPDKAVEGSQGVDNSQGLLNTGETTFLDNFFTNPENQEHALPVTQPNAMGHFDAHPTGHESFGWLEQEQAPSLQAISLTPQLATNAGTVQAFDDIGLIATQSHDPLNTAALVPSGMQHQTAQPSAGPAGSPPLHLNQVSAAQAYSQSQQPAVLQSTPSVTAIHTNQALDNLFIKSEELHDTIDARSQTMIALVGGFLDTTSQHVQNARIGAPQTAPPVGPDNPRLYKFGSDASFGSHGFVPGHAAENHEARAEYLTVELKRLRPINRTPAGTREASPEGASRKRRASAFAAVGTHPSLADHEEEDEENPGSVTKRRRTESGRVGSGKGASSNGTHSVSGRRASAGELKLGRPGPRTGRDPLTEQQKRQNHILSEQKRRNQIKEGYAEMERLVPGLRDGNLSKSNMLSEAALYLKLLIERNEAIEQRLGIAPADSNNADEGDVKPNTALLERPRIDSTQMFGSISSNDRWQYL